MIPSDMQINLSSRVSQAAIFFSILVCLFPTPLTAAELKVAIAKFEGIVSVERGKEKIEAKEGLPIKDQDRIIVGRGKVDVLCNDRWGFRLLDQTDAGFFLNEKGVRIDLAKGNALFRINPEAPKKETFEVSTPTSIAAVRGTEFWGFVNPMGSSSAGTFAVKEGGVDVYLKNLEVSLTLTPAQALDLPQGFQIPSVRSATEMEMKAMDQIDEIPIFMLKANIAEELDVLSQLEGLTKKKESESSKIEVSKAASSSKSEPS